MDRTLTIAAQTRRIPQEAGLAQERLAALFDAHQPRLYRLARRMSRDPEAARDLVQEAFLRAARRPGSLPGTASGDEAWLVRTLVNLCRDRARRERVRRREPGPAAPPAGDPESAAVARAAVQAALARLPPRRRAVVVLRELEDRPVAAIAVLLGVSRVTVRWHLHAARKDLRRLLAGPEEGRKT